MRTLGIDYGKKRVGIAVSDPTGTIARPLEAVHWSGRNPSELLNGLKPLLEEYEPDQLLVGLPVTMAGDVGQSAREVLDFVEKLKESTDLEVVTWDERLSTSRAQKTLKETGWSRQKKQEFVDSMAAQMVLQTYLDTRSRRDNR